MNPFPAIACANRLTVQEAALPTPQSSGTITGWFQNLLLKKVTKKLVDRQTVEVLVDFACRGVIQPFGPQELKIKPEGQRAWNWQMLHTTPDTDLKDDEIFRIKDVDYRVVSRQDWTAYGFIKYELLEAYRGN